MVDVGTLQATDNYALSVWEALGSASKFDTDGSPTEGVRGTCVLYKRAMKPFVAMALVANGRVLWKEDLVADSEVQVTEDATTVSVFVRKPALRLDQLAFAEAENAQRFSQLCNEALAGKPAAGKAPGAAVAKAAPPAMPTPGAAAPPAIPTPGAAAPPAMPTPGTAAPPAMPTPGTAAPPAMPTPGASAAPPAMPTGALANGAAKAAPPMIPTPGSLVAESQARMPPAMPTPGSAVGPSSLTAATFPSTPNSPPYTTRAQASAAPPPMPTPGSLASVPTSRHVSSAPPPIPTPTSSTVGATAQPAYTAPPPPPAQAATASAAAAAPRPPTGAKPIQITPPVLGPSGWKSGPDLNELRMSVIKVACSDNTSVATLQAMLNAYSTTQ
eukprot:TRINITY_DN8539_c0_g4_i1.p1 TRINITY_DN8539_c0_g4~~TRINITY_DN8539_c0_g4_i1.p1  ORF type:complete len:386 (+),score=100.10 TRINITY_DN8539_c0_g4_i1:79-1236(+)